MTTSPTAFSISALCAILWIIVLSGCNQKGIEVDPGPFNATLEGRNDLYNEEDVLLEYVLWRNGESSKFPKIEKQDPIAGPNIYCIVFEDLGDDSLASVEVVLTFDHTAQGIRVASIRERFKCHKDRGHTSWNPEPCN